jgi:hypothetical protein
MFVHAVDMYSSLTVTRRETLWSVCLLLFSVIQRDCLAEVVMIKEKVGLKFLYTLDPCFTPFCCNAPCHFTQLLNLRSYIFGLTPFGWMHSITLTSFFIYAFLICTHLFGNATRM